MPSLVFCSLLDGTRPQIIDDCAAAASLTASLSQDRRLLQEEGFLMDDGRQQAQPGDFDGKTPGDLQDLPRTAAKETWGRAPAQQANQVRSRAVPPVGLADREIV